MEYFDFPKTGSRFIILKNSVFIIFLLFLFTFTSCVSVDEAHPDENFLSEIERVEWQKTSVAGAEQSYFTISKYSVECNCLKIDLAVPEIKIKGYPPASAYKTGSPKMFNLKDVAASSGAFAAINTTPFTKIGKTVGVILADGEVLSEPVEKYCALCFLKIKDENKKDVWRADIVKSQIPDVLCKYNYAFGGFFQIICDNEIQEFQDIKNSRIGAGVSDGGRYLYIMSVTPLKKFGKAGLNYMQCAEIFKLFGCDNAMQFDGGRSCSFVVFGQEKANMFKRGKIAAAMLFVSETGK